jgi:hypothetical protein
VECLVEYSTGLSTGMSSGVVEWSSGGSSGVE